MAAANTGIPGVIGGYGKERVIHAPVAGELFHRAKIVTLCKKIKSLQSFILPMSIQKFEQYFWNLRGLIRDGYPVTKGFKIADIDPRESEKENCFTISDKARCIAGEYWKQFYTIAITNK